VSGAAPRRRRFLPLEIQPGEGRTLAAAAGYSFCLFASYNFVKPLREALGTTTSGIGWLWTGTFVASLLVLIPYWAIVARFPRQRFVPWVHRFFALLFAALFFLLRDEADPALDIAGIALPFRHAAAAFYVVVSVFNLLVITQMWSLLADVFRREQGGRLFAFIAAGSTAGGIAASTACAQAAGFLQARAISPAWLVWVTIALLEAATLCALALARRAPPSAWRPPEPGRTIAARFDAVFEGVRLFARSPYLLWIAAYMFVGLFASAFAYGIQRDLVKHAMDDRAEQTAYYAGINTWTQLAALGGQLLVSAPLLRRAGLAVTLALVHGVAAAGFAAFGAWPELATISASWIALKGTDYALMKPAKETLFTVVSRAEKYQSKSLIDAGLYRFFDMVHGWMFDGLRAGRTLGALALIAALVAAVGILVSRRVAREHDRRAGAIEERAPEATAGR
jgi:AAA family ATP:ADP antiporter